MPHGGDGVGGIGVSTPDGISKLTLGVWLVFGSGDGPAGGSVMQAQGGQSGEVNGAGSG